jgi:putative transposase
VTDVYAAIEQIIASDDFAVTSVCEALNVSRSAYYAWSEETPQDRERRDEQLMPVVRDIFWEHKRRYGARRIAFELGVRGELCGVERVAKLLDSAGLQAIQPKSFKPRTTDSRHTLGYSPNLIIDANDPTRLDELWVADITYVPLADGSFAYLALIMDRCSRKIVGWDLAESMTEALTLSALRSAIRQRQPSADLIHHSDRGGQYAGKQYRAILRRTHILQSMSRAGNCYDNAFMESCFGTIKTELEMTDYETISAARREIATYIAYYNNSRRHSSLGYLTPTEFELNMRAKNSDSHCP